MRQTLCEHVFAPPLFFFFEAGRAHRERERNGVAYVANLLHDGLQFGFLYHDVRLIQDFDDDVFVLGMQALDDGFGWRVACDEDPADCANHC